MYCIAPSAQISSFKVRLLDAARLAARRGVALITLLALLAPAPALAGRTGDEGEEDGAGPSRAASSSIGGSTHEAARVASEDAPDVDADAPWVRGYLDLPGTEFVERPSRPIPARLQNRVGFSEAARAARIARVVAEQDLLLAAQERFAEREREAQARGAAEEALRDEPFREAIVRGLETAQRHLAIEQVSQELEAGRRAVVQARRTMAQARRAEVLAHRAQAESDEAHREAEQAQAAFAQAHREAEQAQAAFAQAHRESEQAQAVMDQANREAEQAQAAFAQAHQVAEFTIEDGTLILPRSALNETLMSVVMRDLHTRVAAQSLLAWPGAHLLGTLRQLTVNLEGYHAAQVLENALPSLARLELLEVYNPYSRGGSLMEAQAARIEVENLHIVLNALSNLSHPVRVRMKGNILYRTAFELMKNPLASQLEGLDEILGVGMTAALHRHARALQTYADSKSQQRRLNPMGGHARMVSHKVDQKRLEHRYFWRDALISKVVRRMSYYQQDELHEFLTYAAEKKPVLFDFFRAFIEDITQDRNFARNAALLKTPPQQAPDIEVLIQEAYAKIDWESLRRVPVCTFSHDLWYTLQEFLRPEVVQLLRPMLRGDDAHSEASSVSQRSAWQIGSEDSMPAGVNPLLWEDISSYTASEATGSNDFSEDAPLDSLPGTVDPDLLEGISSGGGRSPARSAASVPAASRSGSPAQRVSPFSSDTSDDSVHPVDPALFAEPQPTVAGGAASLASDPSDESASNSIASRDGSAASGASAQSLTGHLLQTHTAANPRNLLSNISDYFSGLQMPAQPDLEMVEIVHEAVVVDEEDGSEATSAASSHAAPSASLEAGEGALPRIVFQASVEEEPAEARSVASEVGPSHFIDSASSHSSSSSGSYEAHLLARIAISKAADRTGYSDHFAYYLEGSQALRGMFPEGGYGRRVLPVTLIDPSNIGQLRELFNEGFFPHLETLKLSYILPSFAHFEERDTAELLAMLHAAPQLQQLNFLINVGPDQRPPAIRDLLTLLREAPVPVLLQDGIFNNWMERVPGFSDSFQRVGALNQAWRNSVSREQHEALLEAYRKEEAAFYRNFGWMDAVHQLRLDIPTLFREFLEWIADHDYQDQFVAAVKRNPDNESDDGSDSQFSGGLEDEASLSSHPSGGEVEEYVDHGSSTSSHYSTSHHSRHSRHSSAGLGSEASASAAHTDASSHHSSRVERRDDASSRASSDA